ncbi:GlxA family transcriptional regulator [Roseovarius sp. 2305UL8-3]|uniref:GlxA family transcriptional regulator n=1 Tax=Roseovarius conchicola TaxID=3121636 RepID=UPI003527582F
MVTTTCSPTESACQSDSIVPAGAFFFPVERFEKTRHFAFLLLPEFTLLAFSSAIDPLRIANQLAQKPLYQWQVLSEGGGPVRSSSGILVGADQRLSEPDRTAQVLICSGNLGSVAASEKTLASLRRHSRMGGTYGGICTGAMTLARAGLLRDRTFTLHWENQPAFIETFPDLMPTSRRFETEGGMLTCGGGAAATDMMLWVIARDFGEEFAIAVSDVCLRGVGLDSRPEQRSSLATAISTRNPNVVQVVREMHETIEDPRPLDLLAQNAGYSRRQIERQFRQVFGETPLTVYRNIRLDRARSMFAETDMTVLEVAVACGFKSNSGFSKHYKMRFGVSPSAFRNHGDRRPSSALEGR